MAVLPPAPVPGYVFNPTDEDILDSFLKRKLKHLPLPSDMIKEADVYGTHPGNLTAQFAMANKYFQWFFFTWTTRKHPDTENSTRASRVAGQGRWKSTQSVKLVRNVNNGRVVGSKQNFCYMEHTAQGKEEKTIWLMEEFSIKSRRTRDGVAVSKDTQKLDDWVVCKIYLSPITRKEPSGMKVAAMETRNLERPKIGYQTFTTPTQDSLNSQIGDDTLPQLIDASDQEMVSFRAPCILHHGIPQHPAPQYIDSFGSLYNEQLVCAPNEGHDYAPQHDTASLPEIPHPLHHKQLAGAPKESLDYTPQHDMGSLHEILHPFYHKQLPDAPNEGLHYAPQHDMGSLHEILHSFYHEQQAGAPNEGIHYTPQHDMGSLQEILYPFYHEKLVDAPNEGLDCAPASIEQLYLASPPEIIPPLDLSFPSIDEILKQFDDVPDEAPKEH